ncbi:UNVERIFIED_CONTAM: hypothetical protein Sindi_1678800 [Sesamum indicum]
MFSCSYGTGVLGGGIVYDSQSSMHSYCFAGRSFTIYINAARIGNVSLFVLSQFSTQILQLLDQLSRPIRAQTSKDYGALLQNRDMPDQYAFMPLHQIDDTWISPPFDGWHATSFARQSLLKNTTSAGKG